THPRDLARPVPREPRVALRLSVRRAPHAGDCPSARRPGLRALHPRAQGDAAGFHPQRTPTMMTTLRSSVALASLAALCAVATSHAQQSSWSGPRDSVRLSTLLQQATATDPRQRQFQLSAAATTLRLENIDADKKPVLELAGQAQYQSSVTTIPVRVPNFTVPTPPYDTYDAHLNAQQPLVNPTVAPRRAAERAQLAETQAELRVTLFSVRQDVNDAFFSALLQ